MFKKLKNFISTYKWYLLAIVFVCLLMIFVYQGWFNADIIARGDWKARADSWIKDWFNKPFAWDAGDFGGVPFVNAGRIVRYPLYFFQSFLNQVLVLPYFVTEKLIWFFPFLFVSALSIYFLTKEIFKSKLAGFVAIFIFLFNNFVLFRAHGAQMVLLLSYALTPLAILFFVKSIKGRLWFNALSSGLVLSLIAYNDVRLFVLVFALLFVYAFYLSWISQSTFEESNQFVGSEVSYKRYFSALIIIAFCTIVLNAFWLIPTIFSDSQLAFGGEGFFNLDIVESLSRTNFWHSLAMSIGDAEKFGKFVYLPGQINKTFLFLIPLLALLPLFFAKKNRVDVIFWTLIWIVFAFMAKGLNPPFAFLNRLFYEYVPLASMYRLPEKFLYVMATPFAMLFGLACSELMKLSINLAKYRLLKTIYRTLILIFFVVLPLTIIYPAVIGQKSLADTEGGSSFNSFIPGTYFDVEKWLNAQAPHYKTIWAQGTPRYDFFSFLHPRFEIRTDVQSKSLFGAFYLNAFNYSNPNPFLNGVKYLANIDNFDKILSLVNVRYLMIPPHDDPDWAWQPDDYSLNAYFKILADNDRFNLQKIPIKDSNFFENKNPLPKIYSGKKNMLILGGGKALNYLLDRRDIDVADWNFYFAENFTNDLVSISKYIDVILFFDQDIDDFVLNHIDAKHRIYKALSVNDYYKKLEAYGELRLSPNTSMLTTGVHDIAQVTFDRNVTHEGSYDIWARMALAEYSGNLIEVVSDYEKANVYYPDVTKVDQYTWFKLASLNLTEGQHDFALNFEAENFSLDQVVFVSSELYRQKNRDVVDYLSLKKNVFVVPFYKNSDELSEYHVLQNRLNELLSKGELELIGDNQVFIKNVKQFGYVVGESINTLAYLLDIGSTIDSWQVKDSKNLRVHEDSEKKGNRYVTLSSSTKAISIFEEPVNISSYSHLRLRLKESVGENIKFIFRDIKSNSCHFSIKTPQDFRAWENYIFELSKCNLDQAESVDFKQIIEFGFEDVYSSYDLSWDHIYLFNDKDVISNENDFDLDYLWFKDSDDLEYKIAPFSALVGDVINEIPISYDGNYSFVFATKFEVPEDIYSNLFLNGQKLRVHSDGRGSLVTEPISMQDGIVYTINKQFASLLQSVTYSDEKAAEVFAVDKEPVKVISWEMLNPSKYHLRAKVNSSGFINLLDSYDKGWFAIYNGKKVPSILLTTINNSFLIEPSVPGEEIDIFLEYQPQKLMDFGFIIFLCGVFFVFLFYFFHFRGKDSLIIAMIGPDGAGKSTYVEFISKQLKKQDKKFEICYPFNYFLLRKIIDLFKGCNTIHPRRKSDVDLLNHNFLFKFWPLIAIIDNWFYYIFILRKRGNIVICDRYFYDLATSFAEFGYTFKFLYKLYIYCIPKPDVCFLLDAKASLLAKRETDNKHGLKFFVRQRARYAHLLKDFNWVSIKTDSDLKKCKQKISDVLNNYIDLNKKQYE